MKEPEMIEHTENAYDGNPEVTGQCVECTALIFDDDGFHFTSDGLVHVDCAALAEEDE